MADLKYSWPYIRFLTLAEKSSYVSDLPSDLDTLEVRRLRTSPIFNLTVFDQEYYFLDLTSAERAEIPKVLVNTSVWVSLYIASLGMGLKTLSGWYYNDGVRNFLQFKNESWFRYARNRFWPALAVAWTIGHWVSEKNFHTYPAIFS